MENLPGLAEASRPFRRGRRGGQRALRPGEALPLRVSAQSEYRPLFAQTLLNENPNPSLPFFWTVNPYRGCEFGCGYCFARYTHPFLDEAGRDDFERRVYVKLSAAQALRGQLRPGMLRGRPVALGTATDPYQPAELRFGITRSILEVFAAAPDLDLSITTKSPLILRDLDLLRLIARNRRLRVNITLTTLSPALARVLEGRSPSPRRRLETIRRLAAAGISTAVFVMPIVPGITDGGEDIFRLLRAAREAGADHAAGNLLHLESTTKLTFEPILRRNFPHLVDRYRRLYGGDRLAPARLRARTAADFAELRARAGFTEHTADPPDTSVAGEQLQLGW